MFAQFASRGALFGMALSSKVSSREAMSGRDLFSGFLIESLLYGDTLALIQAMRCCSTSLFGRTT